MIAPRVSFLLSAACGAIACAAAGYASVALAPAWYAPASMATVLPTFMLAAAIDSRPFNPVYFALVSGLALYALFSLPLLFLKTKSQRQWVTALFCVIVTLNTAWIAANLQAGILHQGIPYVVSVIAVNIVWMGFLGYYIFRPKNSIGAPRRPIAGVTLIVLCSVWFAFPWLGEML